MSSETRIQNKTTHGSMPSYIIGFLLSIVLTLLPFLAVTQGWFEGLTLLLVIAGFAIAQLLVQLFFFLHLGRGADSHWNVLAFLFTVLVILIIVIGSIWIMESLNYNMMPTPEEMDEYMKAEAQKGF